MSYQVFDDGVLIGNVNVKRCKTSEKYLAVINREGQEYSNDKEFDTPYDAVNWIEKYRGENNDSLCIIKGCQALAKN